MEYHQHPDTDFYDLGLGANVKEPMLTIITTAGKDLNYPCYTQEYDYCSKVLDPAVDIENDEYFIDICEADQGDDLGALETWQKANPIRAFYPGGVAKIRRAYELAKEIPDKMVAFKTKVLNIWVAAKQNGYMDMQKWKACEVECFPIDLKGRPVYVGFDMSSKIDLTSVSFIVPYQSAEFDETGKRIVKYLLWSHSFIPTWEALREHELKRPRALYLMGAARFFECHRYADSASGRSHAVCEERDRKVRPRCAVLVLRPCKCFENHDGLVGRRIHGRGGLSEPPKPQ